MSNFSGEEIKTTLDRVKNSPEVTPPLLPVEEPNVNLSAPTIDSTSTDGDTLTVSYS